MKGIKFINNVIPLLSANKVILPMSFCKRVRMSFSTRALPRPWPYTIKTSVSSNPDNMKPYACNETGHKEELKYKNNLVKFLNPKLPRTFYNSSNKIPDPSTKHLAAAKVVLIVVFITARITPSSLKLKGE